MGSVVMAMEYDPSRPPFNNKAVMENSDFAISSRPDHNLMYGVECKGQPFSGYFVPGVVGANPNPPINLTTMGILNIGVQNTSITQGQSLGEIWVSYDIELRRPRISNSRFGYYRSQWLGQLARVSSPALIQSTSSYGNLVSTSLLLSGANAVITLPPQQLGNVFTMQIIITFSSSIIPGNSGVQQDLGVVYTGLSNIPTCYPGNNVIVTTPANQAGGIGGWSQPVTNPANQASSYQYVYCSTFFVTGPNPTITVTPFTAQGTASTNWNFQINSIGNNIIT